MRGKSEWVNLSWNGIAWQEVVLMTNSSSFSGGDEAGDSVGSLDDIDAHLKSN